MGGIVGAFVALVLAQRGRLARDFGVGVFAWAAPLLLVAAVPRLWAALLRDVPRTATARTVTDARCRSLSSDVFVPAVTGHGGARAQAEQVVEGWVGSV